MARIVDRRIELDRSEEIPYIGVDLTFRSIWGSSLDLHVSYTYHNILIMLNIPDNGKVSDLRKVRQSTNRCILEFSQISVFGKKVKPEVGYTINFYVTGETLKAYFKPPEEAIGRNT